MADVYPQFSCTSGPLPGGGNSTQAPNHRKQDRHSLIFFPGFESKEYFCNFCPERLGTSGGSASCPSSN